MCSQHTQSNLTRQHSRNRCSDVYIDSLSTRVMTTTRQPIFSNQHSLIINCLIILCTICAYILLYIIINTILLQYYELLAVSNNLRNNDSPLQNAKQRAAPMNPPTGPPTAVPTETAVKTSSVFALFLLDISKLLASVNKIIYRANE